MNRIRLFFACALLSSVIALTATANAQSTDAPANSGDPAAVTNEQAIRRQFGLRSDLVYVAAVHETESRSSVLSIPLSAAEVAEMNRRDAVGESFASLEASSSSGGFEEFAGAWVDQARGGIAVVQVTLDTPEIRKRIAAMLPKDATVDVRVVPRGFRRLKSEADRLATEMATLDKSGVQVNYVAYSPYDDAVLVTVDPARSRGDYAAALAEYGEPGDLQVTEHEGEVAVPTVTHQSTGNPAYGGIRVFGPGGTAQGCTVAATSVSTVYWIVTAGHCGQYGQAWKQGTLSGPSIGTGFSNGFFSYSTSYCDCQTIGSVSSSKATGYVIDAFGNPQAEYSFPGTGDFYGGRPVCMSGASINGVSCGIVYVGSNNYNVSESGHTTGMFDQASATYTACGGDSGAPVVTGNTYMGIQSVGFTATTSRSTPDVGVQPCFNVVGFSKMLPSYTSFYLSSTVIHA